MRTARSGVTKTVNMTGHRRTRATVIFEAAAADQEGSDLLYPEQDEVLRWSETITL
jgi:hypothetical protein